jgi:hypothetical protein
MAREIELNFKQYDLEIHKASMDRIEAAAAVIRDDARRILKSKLRGNVTHPPYAGGSPWTARTAGAMVETIRVVRSKDPAVRNVWVMAGTFLTWWAVQLEFGRGQWRGGAKPFLRPAMKGAEGNIKAILEGGAAGVEGV